MMNDKFCYREDFAGGTVRVLKEKEIKQFGDAPQSDETSRFGGVGWSQRTLKRTTTSAPNWITATRSSSNVFSI